MRLTNVLVAWIQSCELLRGVSIISRLQRKKIASRSGINKKCLFELTGVYQELGFVREFYSQVPEAHVAKLPIRLCGRWAEFVEGKPELSTWESFANWLEKEAKIIESKQRWMPEKRDWKKIEPTKSCSRRIASYPGSSLYAGATREHSLSTCPGDKKCPVHQSTSHRLQECKKFGGMHD